MLTIAKHALNIFLCASELSDAKAEAGRAGTDGEEAGDEVADVQAIVGHPATSVPECEGVVGEYAEVGGGEGDALADGKEATVRLDLGQELVVDRDQRPLSLEDLDYPDRRQDLLQERGCASLRLGHPRAGPGRDERRQVEEDSREGKDREEDASDDRGSGEGDDDCMELTGSAVGSGARRARLTAADEATDRPSNEA